jgi:hypothetical protein
MIDDYERVMARAAREPEPAPAGWPPHMRPDPARLARALTGGARWADAGIRERLATLWPEVP